MPILPAILDICNLRVRASNLGQPGYALVATVAEARRLFGDLDELRALRLKQSGGSVYKRGRSRFWQMKYPVGAGKWRQESAHTESKRDAEALLREKVYQSTAGLLPGTATFEAIIGHFLRDARVRGLRSVPRLERACKALLKRLEGHRAEQIDRAVWLKYLDERQQEAAPDTVHLELSIARRAYRVAREAGLVRALPDIPQVKHLHVRAGFIDPGDWARVREHLRPELRDACDFALACGAREMEVLALTWADVEASARVVHLRATKTDEPRKLPYAASPQCAAVIERRVLARAKRERAAIISPWVFCFDEPVKLRGRLYHRPGDSLFKASGARGLRAMLRANLAAACARAGVPPLLFHDFRRSAARNFERAGVPRSVARMIGGWSDRIYSRYAIGAEGELGAALAQAGEYVRRAGGDTLVTLPMKAQ
jgi:integrase